MKPYLKLSASLLLTFSSFAQSGDILVIGDEYKEANQSFPIQTKRNSIDADSALLLEKVPGITLGRKGGHGNEIIIRGLKNQSLNIMIEDKYLHGGCPNKMDPVTSYIAPEFYEEVEIETGVVTLSEGRGGPGGSIRFVDKKPNFEKNPFSMLLGTGFEDNSNTQHHYTQISAGSQTFGIKGKYSYKDAQNYQDGNGDEILSSFNQQNSELKLYYSPTKRTDIDLSYDYDLARDVMYQGMQMNSPRSLAQSIQARVNHRFDSSSFIKNIKASLYQTDVNHLMENTSGSMNIQVDSITQGAKIQTQYGTNSYNGLIGFDLQNLEQTTNRRMGSTLNYQPAFVNQWGLFAEQEWDTLADTQLKLGLRYDRVNAHSEGIVANSALNQYQQVYSYNGDQEASEDENNVSALMRVTQKIGRLTHHALSLSRSVRTADPYERYIYRPNMINPLNAQLGNPTLSPEKHHQIDYSIDWNNKKASMYKFNLYYNNVSDFITQDRARAQSGVNVSDKRLIYRNVDAYLMGGTLSIEHSLNQEFKLGGSTTYTYGKNTTNKRALYEIPPVLLNLFLDYKYSEQFKSNIEVVSQLKQTRIDSSTNLGAGVDAGESKAWATLNLSIEARPLTEYKDWIVRAGIRNLMDKAYARHVNVKDVLSNTQIRVNDPGRSFWLATEYQF